jgi:hypothetical protein
MSGSRSLLEVNGDSLFRLQKAMELLDLWEAGKFTIVGFTIDENRIVLFEYPHSSMTPFPAPMPVSFVAAMVHAWLTTATYPEEPDHDGDNERGWRLYKEDWGRIDKFEHGSVCAIEPMWIEYDK